MSRYPTVRPVLLLISNSPWNLLHFRAPLLAALNERYVVHLAAPPATATAALPPNFHELHQMRPTRADGMALAHSILELRRLHRQLDPALTLTFTIQPNLLTGLALWGSRRRYLPTLTGLGYTAKWRGWRGRLLDTLYHLAFRRASVVFMHNQDDADLARRRRWTGRAKLRVVPGSGVDLQYFGASELPERRGITECLYVGRLLKDKGLPELLAAIERINRPGLRVRLHVVGTTGSANPMAYSASEWADLLVAHPHDLLPHGHQADVRPFLRACHVFVLPSHREGMPRSTLEALATGRPVVTTDVPGCRDTVLPDQNGWRVPGKDAAALATALLEAHTTPLARLREMGERSRSLAEDRFGIERVQAAYLEAIRQLLPAPC